MEVPGYGGAAWRFTVRYAKRGKGQTAAASVLARNLLGRSKEASHQDQGEETAFASVVDKEPRGCFFENVNVLPCKHLSSFFIT